MPADLVWSTQLRMALLVSSVPLSLTIRFGPATRGDQKIELTGDPLAGERGIGHGSQTLAGAVVENSQDAKAPATGQLIGNEVERPAVIGPQRDRDWRPRSQSSLALLACAPSAVLPDRCRTAACDLRRSLRDATGRGGGDRSAAVSWRASAAVLAK
jgi:hypothetical protein